MARHPQNGPTFSNAPPKKQQSVAISSPARKQAELEEKKRDAAKSRSFHKRVDEVGLLQALGLVKPKPPQPPIRRI
jgi:hypothetical protein